MSTKNIRALVLPGGGFRGAYQAGAVYEMGKRGITFDLVAGASVGSCNGAAFVLNMWEELPELWQQAVTRKIFEPKMILKGKNPFAISRVLKEFSSEHGRPGQFDEVPTEFIISVTNATSMTNQIISFKDHNWSHEELTNFYLASSCIPFICEKIKIRGNWYVDGGLTDNCPISAVIEREATEIWVIGMGEYGNLERNFFRIVGNSLKFWPGRKYRPILFLEHLVKPKDNIILPSHITINEINPSKPLDIGHLHLTKEKVERTIEMGKTDIQEFIEKAVST